MATINERIPLTTAQWDAMSMSQKQKFLEDIGYFDRFEAANKRGDTINITTSDSGGTQSSGQQTTAQTGKGAGAQAGDLLGGVAAEAGRETIKDSLFGKPDAAPAQTNSSSNAPAPTKGDPIFTPQGPQSAASGPMTQNAPNPVGTAANGGTIMSDGSTVMPNGDVVLTDGTTVMQNGVVTDPAGSDISNTARGIQAVGGAFQAYNGYRQWQEGNKISGGANMAGGAYNMYAGATGSGAAAAPYVGAAVGAANIGQNVANEEGRSEDRAAASQTEAAKAALLFVPVYGQAAYAVIAGLDAVSGGKASKYITKFMEKSNNLTDKIDFGLGKSIRSKIFHENTRGVAKRHSAELYNASEDQIYRDYVQGMRAQYDEAPKDPTKPFAGKYATWDDYMKGGLEASDLTGVYGNIKTYGKDWAGLTQEQRQAVTQENINSGIYNSKKGEVEITDQDVARANYDKIIAEIVANNKKTAITDPKVTNGMQFNDQLKTNFPMTRKPLTTSAGAQNIADKAAGGQKWPTGGGLTGGIGVDPKFQLPPGFNTDVLLGAKVGNDPSFTLPPGTKPGTPNLSGVGNDPGFQLPTGFKIPPGGTAGFNRPGHWVDAQGNPIPPEANIDPGYTIGNRFVPDEAAPPPRSAGFDAQGRRIQYTPDQRRAAQNRALLSM